jgi:hypothetical protein
MAKKSKKKESEENEDEGVSLDDAFGDDEDVEYAESKPRKTKKKKSSDEELDEEIEEAEEEIEEIEKESEDSGEEVKVEIKASKPIGKIKKGDRIRVDDKELEVDSHYVMINHGNTKEMVIELFNPVNEKDYQLRYFDDRVEDSLEFFELEEIVYVKRKVKRVLW